jgi:hypothetical protein
VTSGLKKFEKDLNKEVVAEINGWEKHPELSKLLKKLQSIKDPQQFQDHYAEAMVARHLIRQRCELQVEVPTVNCGCADFKVSKSGNTFFVHIKRTNWDKETTKNLKINTRLDCLRKIRRPITVSLIPYKSLTDQEMQFCCKETKEFIKNASEGERKEIKNKNDEVLVEFEIGPCHNGQHVKFDPILLGAICGGDDTRIYEQLRHAYKRFMPEAVNIILVTSAWRDDASIEDLREAVDDFWYDGKHSFSKIIGWFMFEPRGSRTDFKLFFRKNYKRPSYILDLFSLNDQKADINEIGL